MKKAHEKGRGVRISAKELESFFYSFIGQMWHEDDPRKIKSIK